MAVTLWHRIEYYYYYYYYDITINYDNVGIKCIIMIIILLYFNCVFLIVEQVAMM